jgi:hypothetical protein
MSTDAIKDNQKEESPLQSEHNARKFYEQGTSISKVK